MSLFEGRENGCVKTKIPSNFPVEAVYTDFTFFAFAINLHLSYYWHINFKKVVFMSTSSVTLSSSSIPQSSSSTAAPNKSFFNRCIEDISTENVSSLNRKSTHQLIAAVVTVVAFTALAVGAFVAATVFMPIYAPFVAITALMLALPVGNYVKDFLEHSKTAGNEAKKYEAMQLDAQKIAEQSPIQIQAELFRRGINWFQIPGLKASQPETFADLSPVLAHAHYLDAVVQNELKTKDQNLANADKLAKEDFVKHRLVIDQHRKDALAAEDRAMDAKIQSAFVNAVLTKPSFAGTLEDIASLTGITYHERMLGNAVGNSSEVDAFLKFKNNKFAPITYNDVKTMHIAELGKRLSAAMAA